MLQQLPHEPLKPRPEVLKFIREFARAYKPQPATC